MLKTSTVGPGDKNPEHGGQEIQVENRDKKKPAQKNCQMVKNQKTAKGQKTAKSKKWISAKKAETSRAKNLDLN